MTVGAAILVASVSFEHFTSVQEADCSENVDRSVVRKLDLVLDTFLAILQAFGEVV